MAKPHADKSIIMKTYSKGKCGICGQVVSYNGFAMVSHLRKHVREGKLIEITTPDCKTEFKSADLNKNDYSSSASAYF